jgi:hypothetical protein
LRKKDVFVSHRKTDAALRQHDHISRRSVLSMLALGGIGAMLTACEQANNGGTLVGALPDPTQEMPSVSSTPSSERDPEDYAPPARTNPIIPAPAPNPMYEKYDIIPRAAWARGGPGYRVEPMNGVALITFHHSGDPTPFYKNSYADTAQHLEIVREGHRERGFQDIGYHFAIDRMGRVWQLRSLKYQGEHVRTRNPHNLGVVVLGNFMLQEMTAAQRTKVQTFGRLIRQQYGLPIAQVYTHRELHPTECPGARMQPFMNAIRRERLV